MEDFKKYVEKHTLILIITKTILSVTFILFIISYFSQEVKYIIIFGLTNIFIALIVRVLYKKNLELAVSALYIAAQNNNIDVKFLVTYFSVADSSKKNQFLTVCSKVKNDDDLITLLRYFSKLEDVSKIEQDLKEMYCKSEAYILDIIRKEE